MAIKKIAKKRVKRDINDPLGIGSEMTGLDLKDREYYDRFTDEEKKKFSTYLMLRWGASVSGDPLLEQYYLMSVNENVNKNFFDISKHPKLQWLCCTAASPDLGKQRHYWLNGKKKEGSGNTSKFRKQLQNKLPNAKLQDIENILKYSTEEEILLWLDQHGITELEKSALMK